MILAISIGLSVKEKVKIDFQEGGHPGFLTGTIFAIFEVQITPILPTKIRVNSPFGSEETQNRYWPNCVGGVVIYSKLLTPHDGQHTTDIE